jgi:hypothetical protein
VDGPTSVVLSGAISGLSAMAFAASASSEDQKRLKSRSWWQMPAPVVMALIAFALLNSLAPVGTHPMRPILVKNNVEGAGGADDAVYERWNSYSRIVAMPSYIQFPTMWGASPKLPSDTRVSEIDLNIDGMAGTAMFHYDGTRDSISFLQYDLVNLAYRLPGIHKSAVIGVGGGRDLMSAYLLGVSDITGVELNPIFINLHTRDPFYSNFSNLTTIPNLKLHVDDARSWFASTTERFDLVQMSMIDTWAATGAGAFSLSENGLYTLEGWRAFLKAINDHGIFTVSRWYAPDDVNETGRMIGLATGALLDSGVKDARSHLFVARAEHIATLVLSKSPFTEEQLRTLNDAVLDLGFRVLLAPNQPPESQLLAAITESHDLGALDRMADAPYLDLRVPTDNRPFFFNQLRFSDIPNALLSHLGFGVVAGNLWASLGLILILFISIVAVIATILVPLRVAARECSRPLIVFLGHPTYSLGVCLFSLILASGLGSLASEQLKLDARGKLLAWGSIVVVYLVVLEQSLPGVLESTTDRERLVRIAISLTAIMPLGFVLGFAFPTGMRLVEEVDRQPTPWFWGINGATGVLASVAGLMFSMSLGINVTLLISAACYLLLVPISIILLQFGTMRRFEVVRK